MTTPATDEWPAFSSELGRKGLTALEKWIEKLDAGTIGEREMLIITDVMFDLMSGLAGWEDTDVVAAVNKEMRDAALQRRADRLKASL